MSDQISRFDERIRGLVEVDVMLDGDIRTEYEGLCQRAEAIVALDEASFGEADDVVARLAGLCKAIESNRRQLKRPVLDLGKRIDAACDEVMSSLREHQSRLATMIADFVDAKRLARAKADAEARMLAGAQTVARSLDPSTITDLASARSAATTDVALPDDAPRSAVSVRTVRSVEVTDYAAIPHVLNGIALLRPDVAAIRRLLDAGIDVPGCQLVFRRSTATRGKR